MQPELGLRVAGVSALTGKGKHTTTHLEMFSLDGGGAIVDTPGMREFGLWSWADLAFATLAVLVLLPPLATRIIRRAPHPAA